jgi:hypothetical protein
MIVVYDFGIDHETYWKLGKMNEFPTLERCPHCDANQPPHRHGVYERIV